jgi:hypothetical protein
MRRVDFLRLAGRLWLASGGRSGCRGFPMMAPDIELEDPRVPDEPVNRGDSHRLLRKMGGWPR